jgi:16S rRNA (guanine(966)-N(2))-methyltransferase RsmD
MRIIAGSLKGRRLESPAWEGLRPTSDKLRETLFNVLASNFAGMAGARVLDGYAGTGALGLEAISRGASHVTFVERDRRAQQLIAANLARCRISEGYAIIGSTVLQAIDALRSEPPFDLVLLDPPYDGPHDDTRNVLEAVGAIVSTTGVVVLEHARRQRPPGAAGSLRRTRELASGDSALTFYTCQP